MNDYIKTAITVYRDGGFYIYVWNYDWTVEIE
jgi:hypothetical protein